MDALHQVQLLEQVQSLQNKVVERLKPLRFPELWEGAFFPEVMPAHNGTEIFIHENVLQHDRTADDLILRYFEKRRDLLRVSFLDNLIWVQAKPGNQPLHFADQR